LFSLFLTFLLTANSNSHLQSTFSHFKLQILHILFLFSFTSLHFIAQAAHDNFSSFRHQVHQQPFFSTKTPSEIISLSTSNSSKPTSQLQRQLFIISTINNSSFFVFLFSSSSFFSTKHEVSALSGHVLIIFHFSHQSLTPKKFRFGGEQASFWGRHQHFSTLSIQLPWEKMPALQPSTLSPLVSTVQHHISRKLQPFKRESTVVRTLSTFLSNAIITSEGLPLLQHRLFLSHATKVRKT
jgi:hypothetical protein